MMILNSYQLHQVPYNPSDGVQRWQLIVEGFYVIVHYISKAFADKSTRKSANSVRLKYIILTSQLYVIFRGRIQE